MLRGREPNLSVPKKVSNEEARARQLMKPILVKKLKKLLMISMDCQIPLENIDLIQSGPPFLKISKRNLSQISRTFLISE
jgi:Plant organelle RNA recognition domain